MWNRRVMDLDGWPPVSGGAYRPGNSFAISTEQALIKDVQRVTDRNVHFTCLLEGRDQGYDLFVPNENTANKLAAILRDNVGETLFSIGMKFIPED